MTENPEDRASPARMYDYYLGGSHNFPSDRAAADAVIAAYPDFPLMIRANRAFLRRAVEYLAGQGIDQFLDLGSGIPTVGNVHEIAQQHNPDARVVYVDVDPVAVAHSEDLLRGNTNAAVVRADIRDLRAVLTHPQTRRFLDLDRPLAILLAAVLHFFTADADANDLVGAIRGALPSGAYVVISHAASEAIPPEPRDRVLRRYNQVTDPVKLRSRAEVMAYFDGLEVVPPGIVYAPLWRPEDASDLFLDDPARSSNWVGIGRKP